MTRERVEKRRRDEMRGKEGIKKWGKITHSETTLPNLVENHTLAQLVRLDVYAKKKGSKMPDII